MTDPRRHRLVRHAEGDRITYVCGCQNEVHAPSGVLRSVSKCRNHRKEQRIPEYLGLAYYEGLGVLKGGKLNEATYVAELTEALGPIPEARGNRPASLEIGCGVSPYYRVIRAAGYEYVGLDPSRWAWQWMRETFPYTIMLSGTFEDAWLTPHSYGLILAAHCLEHMADAPAAVRKCTDLLAPNGEFWLIVPDDSDQLNPDHMFFFNADTLRSCLEAAGLVVDRLVTRKRIERENFLYARARKP